MLETKDPFRVRKIEPWNSVRITLSIPKEAAQKLMILAQQGSSVLRSMGILSVQVEGDEVISLTLANQNNEATQVLIRQGNNDEASSSSGTSGVSSSSLPSSSPSISSISSSVASISSPISLTPGPLSGDASGMAATLEMLSSTSTPSPSTLGFRSPNVVAPHGEAIPTLPPKTPTQGIRPALGGPFPFVSMTHAAQAIHRNEQSSSNSVVVSNSGSSNAANSTNNSIPSSTLLQGVVHSSSGVLNSTTHPSPQLHLPNVPHGSGTPVLVSSTSTSNIVRTVNVNNESHVTRLILENPPGQNSTSQVISGNVASLGISNSNLGISQAGPSQSLQLQLVNVPPPYPGVNTISSNHSLSNPTTTPTGALSSSLQMRHSQQQASLMSSPTHNPNMPSATVVSSAVGTDSHSVVHRTDGGFLNEVPSTAPASISDSTSAALTQPVSSPLLVNLLQNNDTPSGSPTTPTPASADAYNQELQRLKKTKRGLSMDGACPTAPKQVPGIGAVSDSSNTINAMSAPHLPTTSAESFQFALPLPSSDKTSKVPITSQNLPNQMPIEQGSATILHGRTIVHGNIHILDQGSGQLRSIPIQPPPPYTQASLFTSSQGRALLAASGGTSSSSHLVGQTSSGSNQVTTLTNGPINQSLALLPSTDGNIDTKSQRNVGAVLLGKPDAQQKMLDYDASKGTASLAADQSRTLLPVTTVDIISKPSSIVNLNSSNDTDAKTFIPPPDPRLTSQVQKITPPSGKPVSVKNSSDVFAQKAAPSYNRDAKSSTSQLSSMERAILASRRPSPRERTFAVGQPTGKPRQFLINPLTGHLEPMPSESSEESEEEEEDDDDEDGESSRKSNSHKNSKRTRTGKGGLGIVRHRQIVTTETGVTVARVVKTSPDPSSTTAQSSTNEFSPTVPVSGPPIATASKKLREDSVTSAALHNQNDIKDSNCPSPATVTATSVSGEQIKLRLKLEKSKPISQAYKVDVSYVKKSEKSSILPATGTGAGAGNPSVGTSSSVSAATGSNQTSPGDQPRVPPLHISLRGKNAAVVKSPRREEKDISMPPPPPIVGTGNTKDPIVNVSNKDGNTSESFLHSSFSVPGEVVKKQSAHNLLNSHDGKISKPNPSVKRFKKNLDPASGVLDKAAKIKTKPSRPKVSKEGKDLPVERVPEMVPKDSQSTPIPALQPVVTSPISLPPSTVNITTITTTTDAGKSDVVDVTISTPFPSVQDTSLPTPPASLPLEKTVVLPSENEIVADQENKEVMDVGKAEETIPSSTPSTSAPDLSAVQKPAVAVEKETSEVVIEGATDNVKHSVSVEVEKPSEKAELVEKPDLSLPPNEEKGAPVSVESDIVIIKQVAEEKVISQLPSTPSPISEEKKITEPAINPAELITHDKDESFVVAENPVINLSDVLCDKKVDVKQGQEQIKDSVTIVEEMEVETPTSLENPCSTTSQNELPPIVTEVASLNESISKDVEPSPPNSSEVSTDVTEKSVEESMEVDEDISINPETDKEIAQVSDDSKIPNDHEPGSGLFEANMELPNESTIIEEEAQFSSPMPMEDEIVCDDDDEAILPDAPTTESESTQPKNILPEEVGENGVEKETNLDSSCKDGEIIDKSVIISNVDTITTESNPVQPISEEETVENCSESNLELNEQQEKDDTPLIEAEVQAVEISKDVVEEAKHQEPVSMLAHASEKPHEDPEEETISSLEAAPINTVVEEAVAAPPKENISTPTEDNVLPSNTNVEETKTECEAKSEESVPKSSPQPDDSGSDAFVIITKKSVESLIILESETPARETMSPSKSAEPTVVEPEPVVESEPAVEPEPVVEPVVEPVAKTVEERENDLQPEKDNAATVTVVEPKPTESDDTKDDTKPAISSIDQILSEKNLVVEKSVVENPQPKENLEEKPTPTTSTAEKLQPSIKSNEIATTAAVVTTPIQEPALKVESKKDTGSELSEPVAKIKKPVLSESSAPELSLDNKVNENVDKVNENVETKHNLTEKVESVAVQSNSTPQVSKCSNLTVEKPVSGIPVVSKISVPTPTTSDVKMIEMSEDISDEMSAGATVNVKIMTPKKTEPTPISTNNTPPISIVLPSESLRSNNPDGKAGASKNTYKRRAEIKPGALQNTLKRLHDNLPKVLKGSEKQHHQQGETSKPSLVATAAAEVDVAPSEKPVPVSIVEPMKLPVSNTPTLPTTTNVVVTPKIGPTTSSQPVSVAVRPMANIIQRTKLSTPKSTTVQAQQHAVQQTFQQIPSGLHPSLVANVTAGISSSTLTPVASLSVPSTSSGSGPQTVFAIHPNVSIPANFAQLQQSPVVLPGGHKMVPIKLVTIPKQPGNQLQTIPLGSTPNRSSPNLLEAVNIVASAGSRSSSPKTTLISNAMQSTPLNLSSMSLPVGGNLHFVPISVSSGTGTTGNVKVLMAQPIKMQQSGLSQSMVVKSVLMGNQPATIRVIRPSNNLQEPIAIQINKPQTTEQPNVASEANKQKLEHIIQPTTTFKLDLTGQPDSLFKKLDGVEIVETGSPLNNDDLPFEADIIHDEKDLADVLAAEASKELNEKPPVIENCSISVKPEKPAEKKSKPEVISSVINHVASRNFLNVSRDGRQNEPKKPLITSTVTKSSTKSNSLPSRSPSPMPAISPNGPAPDLHGEDQEIINSFSSGSSTRGKTRNTPSQSHQEKIVTGTEVISDHTYSSELSIEIPPNDIEMSSESPSQNNQEERRHTRSTRSNTRLSPDITAFGNDAHPKQAKLSVKVDHASVKSSPKPSPTGSLKVLSPTPSSLTITPSTSTRSSPILHNQHQMNSSNAAATINAVAMGIIDKIQGSATTQNVKNSRLSRLAGSNKRKRQESDSSSASRDENNEEKAEIDLNSRPGKRKCSENAAEMIKVCIGVEDSPKRYSATSKKTEDLKSKDSKGKKGVATINEEDDDADSEVSGSRARSRSSRESSEDRSSSRGSSVHRSALSSSDKPKIAKEDDSSKDANNAKSSRVNRAKEGSQKLKSQTEKPVSQSSATPAKKSKEVGKVPTRRPNRPNSKTKSPLTPAKTRTNVRKDAVTSNTQPDKAVGITPSTNANSESENARRKTRSSAAGKRHVT